MTISSAARSKARRFILQALYQIQLTGDPAAAVVKQFVEDHDMKRVDTVYFDEVLPAVMREENALWSLIDPLLDRSREELDPVERAILLLGTYELTHRIDVPFRVVIDEAIELARMFGASESYKYVNSILDQLSKTQRIAEQR